MKINDNTPAYLTNLYKVNQERTQQMGKNQEKGAIDKDKLQLSEKAKEISRLVKKAGELPEIREAKIAELKEQIDNHTYKISPQEIAAKMLGQK